MASGRRVDWIGAVTLGLCGVALLYVALYRATGHLTTIFHPAGMATLRGAYLRHFGSLPYAPPIRLHAR